MVTAKTDTVRLLIVGGVAGGRRAAVKTKTLIVFSGVASYLESADKSGVNLFI